MRLWSRIASALIASSASFVFAGCGVGTPDLTSSTVGLHFSGSVYGGQQPIAGASIRLLTVGVTATGAASTPLINGAPVLSNSDGSFSITGTYTCTNATQVYIVAVGGNPGAGTNSGSVLGTALGSCSDLTPSTFITINELTTVAAAYALAPFEGSGYGRIGANMGYASASTGITNAFLTAGLLTSATQPAGLTVPTAELNTLANILAACVNSTGASSPECTQLFNATGASNTFDAAFAIAKNPGSSATTALYSLSSATAPFQPSLTAAPKDFSVAARYTGTTLAPFNGPSGIAIDAAGNALVTQQSGNYIVAVSPLNSSLSASANAAAGLTSPHGIAIDTNGYVWIANTGANNIAQIAPYSTSVSSFPTSLPRYFPLTPGVSNPTAVATDTFGNAYTLSPADLKIFAVKSNGAVLATPAYPSFAGSGAFAFSGAQTLLVGTGIGQTCLFPFISNNTGTLSFDNSSPTCVPAGTATNISALNYNAALGTAGYAGVGNGSGPGAPLFGESSSGSSLYLSAPASTPTALAFDSAGKGFITDAGAVFAYTIAGAALNSTGGFGSLNTPTGVAVDPSGNVWTTNFGDNSLSIFIGLGAPTFTPIAVNLH